MEAVAEANRGQLTLQIIREIVRELSDILEGTYGPDGKAIMINIQSPRQTLVTKVIYRFSLAENINLEFINYYI